VLRKGRCFKLCLVYYSVMAESTQWPDTNIDRRAWELAKVALGPEAPISDVITRANEIKETLKKEQQ